jgi:hypothetical protein
MDKILKVLDLYGVRDQIILDEAVTQVTDEDVDVRELRTFLAASPFTKKKLTQEDVDKEFYPIMIDMVLPTRFVGISRFDNPCKLVHIHQNGREYVFQLEDKVVKFPESGGDHTGGLMTARVIFNEDSDYKRFMTEFVLKFSAWDIKEKVL